MSKPRVDPTFGISSVDVLILTERHPACRRRESQPGSCKERENLAGDAKGKGTNGRSPKFNGRRQPSIDGTSRMMREYQVRICERLGVKFPGPTRQTRHFDRAPATSGLSPDKRTISEPVGMSLPGPNMRSRCASAPGPADGCFLGV